MEVILGVVVGAFILLLVIWKFTSNPPIKYVRGGFKDDVTLRHTEPIELYFADISSMSMKVRMCLAAAGIEYKPRVVKLPSMGSFETKTPEYLRINPAGTVPVLLHRGHPIHESSEQLRYIANELVPIDGPKLSPTDSTEKAENEYWIEQTSMRISEVFDSVEIGLKRRAGNCLPFITMPCFSVIAKTFSWRMIFDGIMVSGFDRKQILTILFSIFGVHVFRFIPTVRSMVKTAKNELLIHLVELEIFLKGKGTKFISGDDITLADMGWASILERMDFAGWWEHIDPTMYPCVIQYWNDMKVLPSYKEATKLIDVEEKFVLDMKKQIEQWKVQYSWFKDLYE